MKRLIRFVLAHVPRKYIQLVAHLVTPVLGLFYRGRSVQCPVCGSHFRKFMPYGYVVSRENALCPNCMALERHRLLWLYLQRETSLLSKGGVRVMHVAPEKCFMDRFKEAFGAENYITVDIESPLATVMADIQALPFADDTFDLVICNHILEHVENDRKALKEICRVLRPQGMAILMCPVNYQREKTYEDPTITTPELREKHFGQKDHVRDYGRDYADRIREAGMITESNDYVFKLEDELVSLHGLRSEVIYIGYKPQIE